MFILHMRIFLFIYILYEICIAHVSISKYLLVGGVNSDTSTIFVFLRREYNKLI